MTEVIDIVTKYLNEVSAEKLGKYISKARENKEKLTTDIMNNPSSTQKTWDKSVKRNKGISIANSKLHGTDIYHKGNTVAKVSATEEVIKETLSSKASASDYIDDFVHSDDPRFKDDSKAKRIRRALGAYYGKKHSVKEEAVEPLLGEDGKKKEIKKVNKESGPDSPIQLNKGVPNRFQNIGRDTGQSI
jgi:hypothetical protein